jgi:predicted Zn finger-like uncharacterized protein
MSLITCCPACATMFKVVPDQLRISEGWVRCGHCAEVFDAAAHLQDRAQQQPAQEEPEPPAEAAPAPPFANAPYPPFVLGRGDYEAEVVDAAAEQRTQQEELPQASEDELLPMAPMPAQPEPEPEPEPQAGPHEQEEPLQDISFVRQARRKAFWRRPAVRAGLALLVLALGLLLAGQYALHDRDRLATAQPALRPLIEALCQPLDCAVSSPRQIEAIAIDSSSFSKLRNDAYRLAFTLKNQAATEIEMPAIELTLTDSQDQPVLRRVLTPADMGASAGVLAPASEWSGTLAMSVAPGGGAGRIAGYRLLAFYP